MTIEIGYNLWLDILLAIVALLIDRWWNYRARGRG